MAHHTTNLTGESHLRSWLTEHKAELVEGGAGAQTFEERWNEVMGLLQPEETEDQRIFREQQQSTLDRLISLEEDRAKAGVPSEELLDLREAIIEQQQALKGLTTERYLEETPGLQAVGISQRHLERVVAEKRDPIANALSNLILSESVLSQRMEAETAAVRAQQTSLQNIFGLRQEIQDLKLKPGDMPTVIKNRLLEEFLFPKKGEELDTQVVTAGGRSLLIDKATGETIKDLGAAYKGDDGPDVLPASTLFDSVMQAAINEGASPSDAALAAATYAESSGITLTQSERTGLVDRASTMTSITEAEPLTEPELLSPIEQRISTLKASGRLSNSDIRVALRGEYSRDEINKSSVGTVVGKAGAAIGSFFGNLFGE